MTHRRSPTVLGRDWSLHKAALSSHTTAHLQSHASPAQFSQPRESLSGVASTKTKQHGNANELDTTEPLESSRVALCGVREYALFILLHILLHSDHFDRIGDRIRCCACLFTSEQRLPARSPDR